MSETTRVLKVGLDEELYRGVSIKNLVWNTGSIFRMADESPSANDLAWHRLSEDLLPTTFFSGFVSHTWGTSPWRKGLTLSMYFFNKYAGIMMFLTLTVLGVPLLAILRATQVDQGEIVKALLFLLIASYFCYFVILLFGGHFPVLLRDRFSERYFLDTCCISRSSDEKMKGIYHLAEYVMASRKFIVLYVDDYTKRLWCVYELAVFFARLRRLMSGTKHKSWVRRAIQETHELQFVFLPVFLPPISIAISISLQGCIFLLLALLVSEATVMLCIILFCAILGSTCLILLGIRWLRTAAVNMSAEFKNFSLNNALVGSQSDRQMILKSINISWNSSESTESDIGLKEFEAFVREEIADFIMEQFGTPINALRCLFANSGLIIAEAFVLLLTFGAMIPFLLATFLLDVLIGDATVQHAPTVLSMRRRITFKRLLIWLLMIIMGIFCAMHSFGYVILPDVALVDAAEYVLSVEVGGKLTYPKDAMADFKKTLLVPTGYEIDATLFHWICSAVFGLLSIAYLIIAIQAIFFRRHATTHTAQVEKPGPLESLAFKSLGSWAMDWLKYIRHGTMPGAEYFWQRVVVMELVEFALQFVKLASYSGKDLFTGETLPASDDKVVVFHTCVICFDMLCMGLCIYFRETFASITVEMIVDILYTLTPIAALGAFVDPAAWHMVRDDDMSVIYFFSTLFPMLRSLSSLSQLDQISLNLEVTREAKVFLRMRTYDTDSRGHFSPVARLRKTDSCLEQRDKNTPHPEDVSSHNPDQSSEKLSDRLKRAKTQKLLDDISYANVRLGRQKGIKPFLELMLRFAVIVGLLTWVLVSVFHPCEALNEVDGWRCDWITHPIFENPPCDCKVLTGFLYQQNEDGAFYCAFDEIYPLVRVGSSLEYIFLQGNPVLLDCALDEERLGRFDDGWLKHLRGMQMNTVLFSSTELPAALSEAKNLRSLQVQVSQIRDLPDWFAEFQQLVHLRFTFGYLETFPTILEKLPKLKEVDLSRNPLCADSNIDFASLKHRYEKFECSGGDESALSNSTGNVSQNGTELCSDYGGLWMATQGTGAICAEESVTTCTDFCKLFLTYVVPLDVRQPKGAFDMEELNSPEFQSFFSIVFQQDDNLVLSDQQLRCSLEEGLGCQKTNDNFGWNTYQCWLSTISIFATGFSGTSSTSDCSECSGSALLPYYSLELQDPADPTKRKI